MSNIIGNLKVWAQNKTGSLFLSFFGINFWVALTRQAELAEVPYPRSTGSGQMAKVPHPGPKMTARPGHMAEVPYPGPKMTGGLGYMAEVPYPGLKMATGPGYMAEVPYPGPLGLPLDV